MLLCISCKGTKELSEVSEPEKTPESIEAAPETAINVVNEDSLRRVALVEVYKEELGVKYQSEANGIISFYILAQQRFYAGEYQNALIFINKASDIRENADILALKGSIYLGLGSVENFVGNWRRALELDPDVPIPPSPFIVQQLQEKGLLDNNLKKNF